MDVDTSSVYGWCLWLGVAGEYMNDSNLSNSDPILPRLF